MQLHFIKASPCRNTTVFITDPVEQAQYAAIARLVMGPEYLAAEQAGFLVRPRSAGSVLRLEMSGGEFCGNATLALAALAVRQGLTDKDVFMVECSGAGIPLMCRVKARADGRWYAQAEMPAPDGVQPLALTVDGRSYAGGVVSLPGISHWVLPGPLPQAAYASLMEQLMAAVSAEAYGIIPYVPDTAGSYSIVPYVYVPAAGSRVFEQACGSGSLSLGHWLWQTAGIGEMQVRQPGGVLTVDVRQRSSIGAEVYFPCEGSLEIGVKPEDDLVQGRIEAKKTKMMEVTE